MAAVKRNAKSRGPSRGAGLQEGWSSCWGNGGEEVETIQTWPKGRGQGSPQAVKGNEMCVDI